MANKNFFVDGGTVQAQEGAVYLRRGADEQLLALCRAGTFSYVLTARQMGKSSLMVNTAEQLAEEGIRTAEIDLTRIGVKVTKEEWYLGILYEIRFQLGLKQDVIAWWRAPERRELSAAQRLLLFFEQVMLAELNEPVVIFVDEIETTLRLDFTDDFFAAVRSVHNVRSRGRFERLSFVLIGVATPDSLIRDQQLTPFNVGHGVVLTDFTFDEASPLTDGLGMPDEDASRVLRRVLHWAGGHPYLTQRVCRAIAEEGKRALTEGEVDEIVARVFFGDKSAQDSNLRFVREMLLTSELEREEVLSTYRAILRGRKPVPDEEQSLVKSHLKLSGVVRREGPALQVRNLIYQHVFNESWVAEHYPVNWAKRLTKVAAVFILVLLLLCAPLAVIAWTLKGRAEENLEKAMVASAELQHALDRETAAKSALEKALSGEKVARGAAEESRKEAEAQKAEAQDAAVREQQARQLAQAAAGREAAQRAVAVAARDRAQRAEQISFTSKLILGGQSLEKENASSLQHQAILFREAYRQAGRVTPLPGATPESPGDGSSPSSLSLLAYQNLMSAASLLPRAPAAAYSADSGTVSFLFSSDGGKLIIHEQSKSGDGILATWDTKRQQLVSNETSLRSNYVSAFLPDGTYLVKRPGDVVFHPRMGRPVELKNPLAGDIDTTDVSLARDKVLLSHLINRSIKVGVWSTSDGSRLIEFDPDEFQSAVFSPDGNYVYTVGSMKGLRVWDIATGQEVLRPTVVSPRPTNNEARNPDPADPPAVAPELRGAPERKERLSGSFSADRKRLLLWNGYVAEVWDLSKPPHPERITRITYLTPLAAEALRKGLAPFFGRDSVLAFGPDGSKFVTLDSGGEVAVLWELRDDGNAYEVARLKDRTGFMQAQFSGDGRSLVTIGGGGFRVWDTKVGLEIYRAINPETYGAKVALSHDGGLLAAVATSGKVYVWNLRGEQEPLHVFLGDDELAASSLARTKPHKVMLDSQAKKIRVWDSNSGRTVAAVDIPKDVKATDISSDGKVLVTLTNLPDSNEHVLQVWRGEGKDVPWKFALPISWKFAPSEDEVAISDDGKYVAAYENNDKTLVVWDVSRNSIGEPIRWPIGWSAGGLVFVPASHSILMYELETDAESPLQIFSIRDGKTLGEPIAGVFEGTSFINTFSQDGKYLVVARPTHEDVIVIDTANWLVRATLPMTGEVDGLDIGGGDDKYTIVTASESESVVQVWKWQVTGQPRKVTNVAHEETHRPYVSVTPDGRYMVLGAEDEAARLWDITEPGRAREIGRIQTESGSTFAVFSPNGEYLLTFSTDRHDSWRWQVDDLLCQVNERLLKRVLEPKDVEFLNKEEIGRLSDPRPVADPACAPRQKTTP